MSNRRRPPENGKALIPGTDDVGKAPALKSTNFHVNFLTLIAAFDEQVKLWDEFCSAWRGRNMPVDLSREGDDIDDARALWVSTREGAEQCLAYMNALWATRTGTLKDAHVNLPTAAYLMWRIVQMAKAWPNEVQWTAEDVRHMAECLEVENLNALVWENLNALVWESVFRDIEKTLEKPPVAAKVLKFLKDTKHIADWQRRLAAVNLDNIRLGGEETIFAL
jgi:hypothetical protein